MPLESAEQELTRTLKRVGPTVAIGRPGEHLPGLGAARFYCSDDRWKQKVADVAADAQLIVWATGVTEGLRWEISHLVERTPPEKLILWAHPNILRLGPQQREAEWSRFLAAVGGAFPKPLPKELGETQFIYFTAGWEPHPVAPPRRPFPRFSTTRATLAAILALKTGVARVSRLGRWFARLGPAGLALLLGAILAAVIAPAVHDYTTFTSENGSIVTQYAGANIHHKDGMLANIALVLVTASLCWGRAAWWRRPRLVVAGGLAVLAIACAFLAVMDEREDAFHRTEMQYRSTTMDMRAGPSEPPVTVTYAHEVSGGVYVKLTWALVVATFAGGFVKTRWSLRPDPIGRPLTDADLAYAGPGDDTFAELIGAGGPAAGWLRAGGFFLALIASSLPHIFLDSSSIAGSAVYSLIWAAAVTAASVVAYRWPRVGGFFVTLVALRLPYLFLASRLPGIFLFPESIAASAVRWLVVAAMVAAAAVVGFRSLRSGFVPLVAAAASRRCGILHRILHRTERILIGERLADAGLLFVTNLFLLAGLSWSVRRMAPRPQALWFGAMWACVLVWSLQLYSQGQLFPAGSEQALSDLLGPVLLAGVMEAALRFAPARKRG